VASRRDFFRTLAKPSEALAGRSENLFVRPPYIHDESLFHSKCILCESKDCVSSCEEEIIVINSAGSPIINLQKGGCTFCEACAEVCKMGVLSLEHGAHKLNARFTIDTNACMAHNGSICFSCKEPCIDDAILFKGLYNPVIDPDLCTGCGFCMGRCPTDAISFQILSPAKEMEEDSL